MESGKDLKQTYDEVFHACRLSTLLVLTVLLLKTQVELPVLTEKRPGHTEITNANIVHETGTLNTKCMQNKMDT